MVSPSAQYPADNRSKLDVDAVIAALGGRFDAAEVEVIERVLRESGGTIPDSQLIEEIGLALAIWRRANRDRGWLMNVNRENWRAVIRTFLGFVVDFVVQRLFRFDG